MDAETANAALFASNYAFPRHATADPDGMSPPNTAPAAQQRFTDSPVSSASRSAADGGASASASAAYLANQSAEKSQRQRKKQAVQPHTARSGSDGRASPAATTATTATTTDQGRRAPLAAAAAVVKDAHNGLPTIRRTVDEGVRMYFVYVHPWLPILHRPTFERQIVEGRVDPILYYA
ncbi:hypothetical protein EV177_010036, partial [Coemansia sp. RSA 1804]